MYEPTYVFPLALSPEWRAELQAQLQQKLTEMLGVEVDTVMADYVLAMVGNKKDMAQIAQALVDFVGEEAAEQFVEWLSGVLPTYEAKEKDTASDPQPAAAAAASAVSAASADTKPAQDAPATTPREGDTAAPTKRIISLKSSSSTSADPKLVSLSSGRGSIRSLSRGALPTDDVLAKRSQRFGAVEKSPPKKKAPAREEAKAGGAAKRKASAEPDSSSTPGQTQSRRGTGGRLSQLLGPPVNVDQAELDARDSLNTNKKTKVNPRSAESERERPSRPNGKNDRNDRNNQENQDADGNRKRRAEQKDRPARQGDAPPLPPTDQPERSDKFGAPRDAGRGAQHGGYYNGPPGYGGFPPPPYGHPMYFQPPPFGQMPPPYGMGFPPPHHGGPGYYGGPGPYGGRRSSAPMGGASQGGRAPRAGFQNRTWVNPNVAKAEEKTKAEGASDEGTDAAGATTAPAGSASSAASKLNPGASAFAPRNPYYGSQMRPYFQNKTWVRQDPAKDEEFSLTLPTTPPPDGADIAE